ncbi:xanthine dehydrogenase [Variovorax sp. WS11]|uniref:xanthine dehydrogenase family protein molybdopterin-binding subunit n=1 Tax=Variovorax sp. WS11 TaxID=1105204 RepID=UPI000D0DF0AD|nr:xanthine dehydrogenase family protein molybdopterin-binding subunit [Variovorax sp. WS11]NDZ17376.1 xanthine dehydrogenase family protein molybdopterin-binding subunit [Variovorax sp. WS11]PSL86087.1 xanthine dehydrogenase [Variovorax sp. WS11]
MQFTHAAGATPLDAQTVVGQPLDRIDGPLKVSGKARYSYESHETAPRAAYGWVVTAGIAKGRITRMDSCEAERAPGVLLVYTHRNVPRMTPTGRANLVAQLSGPEILQHGQAVAFVVAEGFEQARAAASLLNIEYERTPGRFDLEQALPSAVKPGDDPSAGNDRAADTSVGDFESAFRAAPFQIDARFTTPDQHPAMMEPQATTAQWDGDRLTLHTSHQMANWCAADVAAMVEVPVANVRVIAAYVGGGFGGKLRTYAEAVLSAFAARELRRPVKTALARHQVLNHTTRRAATIQRVRLGAAADGRLTALGHETWTGNLPGRSYYEGASRQSRTLYAAPNRMTAHRVSALDLPEAAAMRAPATATGQLAFEVALDELAEKLRIDPVQLRILNDSQHDPEMGPSRPYSGRKLVQCLREGALRFGWSRRSPLPAQQRDGRWLIGMGVASATHHHSVRRSSAAIRLDGQGRLTVQTSMTDIGTGSYTVLAQIAAEMLGVPMAHITVQLGDTLHPAGAGSIASIGAGSAGSSVYDGCQQLRDLLAQRAGFDPAAVRFEEGRIVGGRQSRTLGELAGPEGFRVLGAVEPGDLAERYAQAAFGAHFCEVGVDIDTGETRVRRMLGVFAAGRILNPKLARSQAIGAMVFGIGAALMEEAVVDKRHGYFVNHDMAEYLIPAHADVPAIEAIHLQDADDLASPIKAKGIGELGTCGSGAAVANAIYNATGVRVRDYPITLDKLLSGLPLRA